ncbi:MAG TPA: UDP-N-acetylglucosamine 2-epimerase (non-hydrolyzing) [Solirubrobacteraceae bacterium]|nr:UDP-N-acetylglucosamine 2-epimerase (non-hydrolyzing) [Solirubrobacteraceae bacterium]
MRVLTVIGNRPQFIKAAAVSPRLRAEHSEILVHTGQHHDDRLSAIFFAELGLPVPEVQLGIAGGSNTSQTARQLAALEPVLARAAADVVLVYGDTNSTLTGALAAAQAGVPVAHVEAGMRSFDRTMPEEINRVSVDHLSSLLLCSSPVAVANLAREGVTAVGPPPGRSVEMVGDVMVDVAFRVQPAARERDDLVRARGLAPGGYVLATAHRAGNVDTVDRLRALVGVLAAVSAEVPVLLALHPRTRARLAQFGLSLDAVAGLTVCEPLGYVELTALLVHARGVLTDSGGLQKEAYLAAVPCVTLRPSTEWVETVQAGWNTLVDLDRVAAVAALGSPPPNERPALYGDGRAGERVLDALVRHLD